MHLPYTIISKTHQHSEVSTESTKHKIADFAAIISSFNAIIIALIIYF